ncbi:MAG: helix-turn-helix domain-containing protein, partial [Limisphaerales bacterium]
MSRSDHKPLTTVRPSAQQAENLRRSRRDRAVEVAQDYVEAIADLSISLGEARVVDLARRLGVTHVTVNRTLSRLQQAGYVNTKPYRAIFLTDAGRKLAEECKRRHETVAAFYARWVFQKKWRKWTPRASSIMSAPKRWRRLNGGWENTDASQTSSRSATNWPSNGMTAARVLFRWKPCVVNVPARPAKAKRTLWVISTKIPSRR